MDLAPDSSPEPQRVCGELSRSKYLVFHENPVPTPPVPSVFPLEQYLYVYLCVFRVNTCAMPQAHS